MTIDARHERRFRGAAVLAFAAAFLAALLVPELARADDSPLPGTALGADLRAAVSTGDKQAVAAALDLPPAPRPVEERPSAAWTPTPVYPAALPESEPVSEATPAPAAVTETSGTGAPETPQPTESASVGVPADPPPETSPSPPVEATPAPPQATPSAEQVTPAVTLTVPTPPPADDSSASPSITLIVPPTPEPDTPVVDDAAEPPPPAVPASFPELLDPPAVLAEAPPPRAPAADNAPAQVRPVPPPSEHSIMRLQAPDPAAAMASHAGLALAVPTRAAAAEQNSFPLLPPDPLPDAPSAPFGLSAAFSGSGGASPLVMFAIVVALLLLVPPWFARRLPIRAAVWRQGTLPAPLPRPG